MDFCSSAPLRELTRHENIVPLNLQSLDLRSTILHAMPLSDLAALRSALLLFTSAPKFSKLQLRGSNFLNGVDDISALPWAGLTELYLEEIDSIAKCIGILDLCRALVKCSLLMIPAATSHLPLPPTQVITIPHLTSLLLSMDDRGTQAIFERLRVRELRELSITSHSIRWHHDALSDLLERSGCYLSKLCLLDTHTLPEQFLALISHRALSTLTHLEVQEHGWVPDGSVGVLSTEVLTSIALGGLAPRLHSLILSGRSTEEGAGRLLVDMVVSRATNGMLKKFVWSSSQLPTDLSKSDLIRLKEMGRYGLELDIVGSGSWASTSP